MYIKHTHLPTYFEMATQDRFLNVAYGHVDTSSLKVGGNATVTGDLQVSGEITDVTDLDVTTLVATTGTIGTLTATTANVGTLNVTNGIAVTAGSSTFSAGVTANGGLSASTLTTPQANLSGKLSLSGIQYAVPLTGDTVTINATSPGVMIKPADTIATLTVVFPDEPSEGQIIIITSVEEITAITYTLGEGHSFAVAPSAGLDGTVRFLFTNDIWFPI